MGKKSSRQFVHTHVHSDFSLLDGAASIPRMVQLAAADGQPGIAVSDHGSMGGTIQLFNAAHAAGITPIPAVEVYHVPDADVAAMKAAARSRNGKHRFHMILLAYNEVGYRNLLALTNEGHLEHNYGMNGMNVDDEMLARYSEGVIATSGCLGSMFNQALLSDNIKGATRIAERHQDIFGKDRYFIELQKHGIRDQERVEPHHLEIAKRIGAPLLATNDSHYVSKDEAHMHDALLCLQTGAKLRDEERFRFDGDGANYFRTAEEMWELFPEREYPGACSNTLLIEEMAQGMDIGHEDSKKEKYLIPKFEIDDRYEGDAHAALLDLANKGLNELYAEPDGSIPDDVQKQFDYEMSVIRDMGFDNYFLIVSDIIQWAKRQGIRVGPGRGSAAGSVVAYCTRITGVDPLKYKLYFERFLNPGRKSMPDIDIDFERDRRIEVQRYVAQKYQGRVAYIATYGVLKPKSALKGAARVLNQPVANGNRLSGAWPGVLNQAEASIADIIAPEPTEEKWKDHHAVGSGFRKLYAQPDFKEAIDLASQMEGIKNQKGIHAAGLLITPGPLSEHVPVHQNKDYEVERIPVCAYDKNDSEAIGGLKMDLLGLVNLSVIGRAIQLIEDDLGQKVDIDNIPLDDQRVYSMLGKGESDGVFQLESSGMRDLLRRVAPTSIEDISAVIALFRPGPMGSNLHVLYADAKNGRTKIEVPHKDMHEMFRETYSALVYQEQLIQIAQHYAGYDAAQADAFRKAVGKKDAAALAKEEVGFKKGVVDNGYGQKVADKLWEMIPPFAAYAFNKAHSVAYGFVSYQTAWLKVNFPAQYAAACIDFLPADKVYAQVDAARRTGVQVSPPNINRSNRRATTTRDRVWLGLAGIANCGPAALDKLFAARNDGNGDFKNLGDFLVRASSLNKKATYNLISAGCFDHMHRSRKAMHDNLDSMLGRAKKMSNAPVADAIEDSLFADLMADSEVKGAMDGFDLDAEEYGVQERLRLEIGAIGFPTSDHPFNYVKKYLEAAGIGGLIKKGERPISSDLELVEGEQVLIYGTAAGVETREAKGNAKPRVTWDLENDQGDMVRCTSFGYDDFQLVDGMMVVVSGRVGSYAGRDGEDVIEVRVQDARKYSLDRVVAETNRAGRGGDDEEGGQRYARRAGVRAGADRERRRRREDSDTGRDTGLVKSSTAVATRTVTFKLKSQAQVNDLIARLNKYGEGDTAVVIRLDDSRGESDVRYDINEKRAEKIANALGIKVKWA